MDFDDLALSETAATALESAALRMSEGQELQTGPAAAALIAVDSGADWGRIRLRTGLDERSLALARDDAAPGPTIRASWRGIGLSPAMARGLATAAMLGEVYDLTPIQPGLLALALFSVADAGASRALKGGLDPEERDVLGLLQEELLEGELEDLEALLHTSPQLTDPGTSPIVLTGAGRVHLDANSAVQVAPARQKRAAVKPRGRILWRTVMLAAMLLLLVGVFTSRGLAPAMTSQLTPPYDEPTLASSMMETAEVSEAYGSSLIAYSQGPPAMKVFLSSSPFASDLRRAIYDQAWERVWLDPADMGTIMLRALEFRRHRDLASAPAACGQGQQLDLGPNIVADTTEVDERTTSGCADIRVGRTQVMAAVWAQGKDRQAQVRTTLQRLVDAQGPRIVDSPDTGSNRVAMTDTRRSILRAWLLALLGFAALITIPPLLFDRATYERLKSPWGVRRSNTRQLDVEPRISRIRRIARALAWARLCAMVWGLRLSEEAHLSGTWTLVVLLAVFVGGLMLQRRLIARVVHPNRQRLVRGAALVPLIIGGAAWAGISAAAIVLAEAGIAGSALGIAPDAADWRAQRFGVLIQLVAAAVLLLALIPITVARRFAMRGLRNSAAPDDRAPVLLLRSFTDDRVRMRARLLDRANLIDQLALRRWESFEEVEAAALSRYGPVFAVATPGEILPPALGAVRMQFSHEEWQVGVAELVEKSVMIAVTVGRSAGLVWELARIRDAGLLHKTIFLIPPVKASERRARLSVLAEVMATPWECFDTGGTGRTVLAVCWPLGSADPLVVTAAGPDDIGYDVAIETCCIAQGTANEQLWAPPETTGEHDQQGVTAIPGPDVGDQGAYSRRPPVAVIPAGKSKRPKSWRRQPWAWAGLGYLVVLPVLMPLLTGDPLGRLNSSTTIGLNPAYAVTEVLGQDAKQTWMMLNNNEVATVDIEKKDIKLVGVAGKGWLTASMKVGPMIWYVSPTTGEVGAFDTDTGSERWTTHVGPGVRAITLSGNELVVADPLKHSLTVLDPATGQLVRRVDVGCSAWDVTTIGTASLTVCPDTSEVVTVASGSTSAVRRASAAGASRIFAWRGHPYVFSAMTHQISSVDAGPDSVLLWSRSDAPQIAATGDTLAVEGIERVTILSSASIERRNVDERLSALGVTPEGDVIAGDGDLILIMYRDQMK